MYRSLRSTPLLAALALLLGHGTASGQTPSPTAQSAAARSELGMPSPATVRRSQVIEQGELHARAPGASAMEVIRQLRPEFLRRNLVIRGGDRVDDGFPAVYLDGVRLGGIRDLETIPADVITRIRFLKAAEAAEWVGREHRSGVIAVSTGR